MELHGSVRLVSSGQAVGDSPNRCVVSRQHGQGVGVWVRADMHWGGPGHMHVGQGISMWWVAWNTYEMGGTQSHYDLCHLTCIEHE